MKKRVSPELAAKKQKADEAFAALESRHLSWIIGAAIEHFAEAIEHTEIDIMRHETFRAEPEIDRFGTERERAQEVERDRARRLEYVKIVRFLRALSDVQAHASSELFAAALREDGYLTRK